MSRWWSRLFGQSEPPPQALIDPGLEKAINLASEYVAMANSSLRSAIDSRNVQERQDYESMVDMALFQLQTLQIWHPCIKLPAMPEFERDLAMVKQATKDLRSNAWRKYR